VSSSIDAAFFFQLFPTASGDKAFPQRICSRTALFSPFCMPVRLSACQLVLPVGALLFLAPHCGVPREPVISSCGLDGDRELHMQLTRENHPPHFLRSTLDSISLSILFFFQHCVCSWFLLSPTFACDERQIFAPEVRSDHLPALITLQPPAKKTSQPSLPFFPFPLNTSCCAPEMKISLRLTKSSLLPLDELYLFSPFVVLPLPSHQTFTSSYPSIDPRTLGNNWWTSIRNEASRTVLLPSLGCCYGWTPSHTVSPSPFSSRSVGLAYL